MRLFFAVELGAQSKAEIAAWRDRFAIAAGRPVPPANFHITLAFLGEIETRRLEQLCDRVDSGLAALPSRPPPILLDQVGYWSKSEIYWLGCSADRPDLARLAGKLGAIGQPFGARRQRQAFVPHVTLHRRCPAPPPAPLAAPRITVELAQITLFESKRGRESVFYEALAAWSLSPAGPV